MVRTFVITVLLSVALHPGCQDDNGESVIREQSATARAQCEREAQENEPPGVRGTLAGAFETTLKAVKAEYRRLYDKDFPGLGEPSGEPVALCYYDVPAEQTAGSRPGRLGPIERVSIVVDPQLNAVLIHGGPKSAVPVEAID